jgi:hypothetical protein
LETSNETKAKEEIDNIKEESLDKEELIKQW